MVKLFVGGIAEGVDSMRLRQLFSQFIIVDECDVIKDYAFVHVATEEQARIAIEKLDGYILEGKPINIRWSTSELRKEPGMDKSCFRCGSMDHKTRHCPNDPSNHISLKRARNSTSSIIDGAPEIKRLAAGSCGAYASKITIDLTGRTMGGGNFGSVQTHSTHYPQVDQSQHAYIGSTAETGFLIPRPTDSELIALHDQYLDSRNKYFYFRDRLVKELRVRSATNVPSAQFPVPFANTYYTAPVASTTQNQSVAPYMHGKGQHYYANAMRK